MSCPTSPSIGTSFFTHSLVPWIVLLALCNVTLLFSGQVDSALMFDATAVTAGQWWRLLTWPFVHVSRYNLLLDGLTFLCLYQGLERKRWLAVLFSAVGSLALPLLFSTDIYIYGLCGLSGMAHGLMAVSCLELMQSRDSRVVGGVFLAVLVAKTVWEVATGSVVFHSLHLGDIGHPVVTTHLGGLLGGVAAFVVSSVTQKHRRES